jgi:DHA3 family macrolide efflux protein-like MFS transporter
VTQDGASPKSGPASGPAGPSYRRVLGHPAFARLWSAQLVSQSGDWVFEVALLWLVLQSTHSALDVGIVVTGTIVPRVALGPFLGVYIDRWDRRRTLIATNLAQGAVVAALSGLVVAGRVDLDGLFGIVLLLGAGSTVVGTATSAYVPSILPPEDLGAANGLLSVGNSANQVLGLALGGVFVALLGPAIPIEFDALSFFAAAGLLAFVRGPPPAPPAPDATAPAGFRAELAEGFSYLRSQRFLLELIVVGSVVNFFGNGLSALFAPYAADVLHGTAATYGFIGAAVAAGSVVGATAIGRVNTRRTAGKWLFAGGVVGGLVTVGLALTRDIPLAYSLMFGFGVVVAGINLPLSVLFQAKVPHRLLGRVGAAFGSLIAGTSPFGSLFAGWVAQHWSVPTFFLLSGVVFLAAFGLGAIGMRTLRTIEY